MELEPAIRNDLVELIAANFKTHEVNELGRLLLGSFDSNEAAGKRSHISLSIPNWGCLKDGREHDLTVASLDIVGNSAKVRKLGTRKMEKMYATLWRFLREKLCAVDGRIWSWAGDGGIIAFALKNHRARAVRFAIELQSTVPVFNLSVSGSPTADIALRVGIDSGRVKFCIETGSIVSEVINYAAHLEKSAALPGTVAISRSIYDTLPPRLASVFRFGGIFEEKDYFRTIRRLDSLLCKESPDARGLMA